jgi:hypothetical protein
MAWAVLLAAGLLEITWAIGLKYTEGFTRLTPSVLTLAAMAGSVLLLGSEPPMPYGPGSAPSERQYSASSCSANRLPGFAWRASA